MYNNVYIIQEVIRMLFRKKIEPSCNYCTRSAKLSDGQLLCSKKGIVSCDGKCMAFRYDPFKRIPAKPKALDFSKYKEEDFSL